MITRRTKSDGMALTVQTVPGQLSFGGLDHLLGYHLRRAQGAVHRDYLDVQHDLRHKLTQRQTAVMWLVLCNPGVAQGAIGNALGMDRATMMVLVNGLVSRGLLRRTESRVDRRRRELHATAAGVKLMQHVRRRISRHESRLRQLFSASELRTLQRLLQRLQAIEMHE
jgi:DNA-binding MarR family transcriptional regulator